MSNDKRISGSPRTPLARVGLLIIRAAALAGALLALMAAFGYAGVSIWMPMWASALPASEIVIAWLMLVIAIGVLFSAAIERRVRAVPIGAAAGLTTVSLATWITHDPGDGLFLAAIMLIAFALLVASVAAARYADPSTNRKTWREIAHERGICWKCRYTLRGLRSERCPECGTPIDHAAGRRPMTQMEPEGDAKNSLPGGGS